MLKVVTIGNLGSNLLVRCLFISYLSVLLQIKHHNTYLLDDTFCMVCFVVMLGRALTVSRRMGSEDTSVLAIRISKNHCSPRFPFKFFCCKTSVSEACYY